MKPFVIFTALLLTLTLAAGLLYVGFYYGSKSQASVANTTLRPTTIPLTFKPPIPLNNPSIISAHMNYALDVIIGETTTKNSAKYLTLENLDHSTLGTYKVTDQPIIADSKTKAKDLTLTSVTKGREAQVTIYYGAFQGGDNQTYISYIMMK